MYSLEESTFLCRFCCAKQRAFTQTIWTGTKDSHSSVVMKMKKEWTCPASPCTCCCIPVIEFSNADDSALGTADVPCFFCLPKIAVRDITGKEEYAVQMPSCCGGLCVDCMAEGLCNCKIPFYVYPPGKRAKGEEIGKIIKLWRGLGTEVFTDAASFQLEFPPGIDEVSHGRPNARPSAALPAAYSAAYPDTCVLSGVVQMAKARLLGTTMFVNILFFEKGNEN